MINMTSTHIRMEDVKEEGVSEVQEVQVYKEVQPSHIYWIITIPA